MLQTDIDIWFGPGGLRGVFGAGVACGLQELINRGDLDPSRLRLYGSSVGCLNAAYLATGNADCGLDIYREDVSQLICVSNLFPSLAARMANRMGRTFARGRRLCRVPNVLNVDHVFAVMQRRTPDIVEQLRNSPSPVFSEFVDRETGEYRHEHLQSVSDPLRAIERSLACFPFACPDDRDALDSGIRGYGFIKIVDQVPARKCVVVLNEPTTPRLRGHLCGIVCATLAASPSISRLYLQRQKDCSGALRSAQGNEQVLLISPARPIPRRPHQFSQAHEAGRNAAGQIIRFAALSETGSQPMPRNNAVI